MAPKALAMPFLLLAVVPFSAALGKHALNPLFGYNQKNLKIILDTLAGGKWKPYDYGSVYESSFRPPPTPGSNATLITVSIKNLRVTSFNESNDPPELQLIGTVGLTWEDSRLTFDVPDDYDKDYISSKMGNNGYRLTPWTPSFQADGEGCRNHYCSKGSQDVVFITTEGMVYAEYEMRFYADILTAVEGKFSFKAHFFDSNFYADDVQYVWTEGSNGVTLKDERAAKVKGVNGTDFSLSATPSACVKEEYFGPIGVKQIPCFDLKLELTDK